MERQNIVRNHEVTLEGGHGRITGGLSQGGRAVKTLQRNNISSVRHGGALLFFTRLSTRVLLSGLRHATHGHVLLTVRLLSLRRRQVLAKSTLALALRDGTSVIYRDGRGLIISVGVRLSARRLGGILNGRRISNKSKFRGVYRTISHAQILEDSLLRHMNLFSQHLISNVTNVATGTRTSASSSRLKTVIQDSRYSIIIGGSLSGRNARRGGLLKGPSSELFGDGETKDVLAGDQILQTLTRSGRSHKVRTNNTGHIRVSLSRKLTHISVIALNGGHVRTLTLGLGDISSSVRRRLDETIIKRSTRHILDQGRHHSNTKGEDTRHSLLKGRNGTVTRNATTGDKIVNVF